MSEVNMSDNDILLRDEVMEKVRFTSAPSFHDFFKNSPSFPKPFKIGRRNAWYRKDIDNWLEAQRAAANA